MSLLGDRIPPRDLVRNAESIECDSPTVDSPTVAVGDGALNRSQTPVELFSLDGRPELARVRVETTDVSAYQSLLMEER